MPYQAFPERVGPRITSLEQVIYSVVEKKNNLNEKNWKSRIEDRGSRIEESGIGDRGSRIDPPHDSDKFCFSLKGFVCAFTEC